MTIASVLIFLGLSFSFGHAEVALRPDAHRVTTHPFAFAHGSAGAGLLAGQAKAFTDQATAARGANEALDHFRRLRRGAMAFVDDSSWADELFLAVAFTTNESSASAQRRAALRTRALERVVEEHRPLDEPGPMPLDPEAGDVVAGFVVRGSREIAAFLRRVNEAARQAARGELDSRERVQIETPDRPIENTGLGLPSLLFPFSKLADAVRSLATPTVLIPMYERYHQVPEFGDWLRAIADVARSNDRRRWAHLHFGTLAAPAFVTDALRGELAAAGRGHHRLNFDAMVGGERAAKRELRDLIIDVGAYTEPNGGGAVLTEIVRYNTSRPPPAGTRSPESCDEWLTR